jgi:hypothetical protein
MEMLVLPYDCMRRPMPLRGAGMQDEGGLGQIGRADHANHAKLIDQGRMPL